jgi:hypothetical protein
MKIMAMMAMAVVLETAARGDEVTVYVSGLSVVPASVLRQAETLANEIFAGAEVKIDWPRGGPSRSHRQAWPIVINLMTDPPSQLQPEALAFALPYEGVHIDVFYDRVQNVTGPALTPNVLAHVLVHEITHILQGTCRHSDRGVMKAHWTHQDYVAMGGKALSFTEQDVQLIRAGLAKRVNAGTLIAATR